MSIVITKQTQLTNNKNSINKRNIINAYKERFNLRINPHQKQENLEP